MHSVNTTEHHLQAIYHTISYLVLYLTVFKLLSCDYCYKFVYIISIVGGMYINKLEYPLGKQMVKVITTHL